MNNNILVFTVLLVVFPNLNQCHRCRQSILLSYYDCTYLSFTDIPEDKFGDVFKLDLSFNQITTLKNDSFLNRNLVKTGILLLANNNITSVEVDTFRGMSDLDFLNLNNNDIVEIPADLFKWNVKLRFLRFENNTHLKLPEVGFHLPELNVLDLEQCGLETIPPNFFSNMTDLEKLYLRKNKLSYLDPELIRPLIELEFLDLRENLFVKLQTHILRLPLIFEISYAGNPLLCDCSLLRAYSLYKKKAISGYLHCQYGGENITLPSFERQVDCSSSNTSSDFTDDRLPNSYGMAQNMCHTQSEQPMFVNQLWWIITIIIVVTLIVAVVTGIIIRRTKVNAYLISNRFRILKGDRDTRDSVSLDENETM